MTLTDATGTLRQRILPAILIITGLAVGGCSAPDVQAMRGGPPIGPVTAPRQVTVDWAQALCTTVNPLLDATTPPIGEAADPQVYLDRLTAAQAALRQVNARMYAVGPPPAADAQVLLSRVSRRLDELGRSLDDAATSLRGAPADDRAAALATARSALGSFDHGTLLTALQPDPAVQAALVYAPACVRSA